MRKDHAQSKSFCSRVKESLPACFIIPPLPIQEQAVNHPYQSGTDCKAWEERPFRRNKKTANIYERTDEHPDPGAK